MYITLIHSFTLSVYPRIMMHKCRFTGMTIEQFESLRTFSQFVGNYKRLDVCPPVSKFSLKRQIKQRNETGSRSRNQDLGLSGRFLVRCSYVTWGGTPSGLNGAILERRSFGRHPCGSRDNTRVGFRSLTRVVSLLSVPYRRVGL